MIYIVILQFPYTKLNIVFDHIKYLLKSSSVSKQYLKKKLKLIFENYKSVVTYIAFSFVKSVSILYIKLKS